MIINQLHFQLSTYLFVTSGPEAVKLFSCSTQLSTKFHKLIITKILTNKEVSYLKFLDVVFNILINVKGLVNLQKHL